MENKVLVGKLIMDKNNEDKAYVNGYEKIDMDYYNDNEEKLNEVISKKHKLYKALGFFQTSFDKEKGYFNYGQKITIKNKRETIEKLHKKMVVFSTDVKGGNSYTGYINDVENYLKNNGILSKVISFNTKKEKLYMKGNLRKAEKSKFMSSKINTTNKDGEEYKEETLKNLIKNLNAFGLQAKKNEYTNNEDKTQYSLEVTKSINTKSKEINEFIEAGFYISQNSSHVDKDDVKVLTKAEEDNEEQEVNEEKKEKKDKKEKKKKKKKDNIPF
jgi:hypothetical protein